MKCLKGNIEVRCIEGMSFVKDNRKVCFLFNFIGISRILKCHIFLYFSQDIYNKRN